MLYTSFEKTFRVLHEYFSSIFLERMVDKSTFRLAFVQRMTKVHGSMNSTSSRSQRPLAA